jgi:hypothetical protein
MANEWVNIDKNVPRWVDRECQRIWKRAGGSSSSYLDKYWVIEGHHYVYKVEFSGQGGTFRTVCRKKRHTSRKKRGIHSLLSRFRIFVFGK